MGGEKGDGKVVLQAEQESHRVFSAQVAYILKELLKQPVEGNHGTATYCSISGIDVAAKTGTTDENYDKWLCGFTPYYTAVTWFGFDENESIYYYNQNPAGIIWSNVMRRVHDGLTNASFREPSWITTDIICADTGMLAKTGCTNIYEEYFLWGTEPDECTKHSGRRVTVINDEEETPSTNVYRDDEEELELDPDDTKHIVRGETDGQVENEVKNETANEIIDNEVNEIVANEEEPEAEANTITNPPVNNTVVDDEPENDNNANQNTAGEPPTDVSGDNNRNEVTRRRTK